MRSIEQIIHNFRSYLYQLNSQLSSFNKFGNLYFLIRAVAGILNEQETDFDLKLKQRNLLTAENLYLDQIGYEYGIYRDTGKNPTGYVLATSTNQVSITQGTVLVDNASNYGFQTIFDYDVQGQDNILAVESLETKTILLEAGTELYSAVYPGVDFVVGAYRDINGNPQESISGGVNVESDESFRSRIIYSLNNYVVDTAAELEILISELELVDKVITLNNEPRVGYFTVLVDTQDQYTREQIVELIEANLPLGSNYVIKSFSVYLLDLQVSIRLNNLTDVDAKRSALADLINEYLLKINPGEGIKLDLLNREIILSDLVDSATIILPEFDIELDANQVPKLNNLSIILEV